MTGSKEEHLHAFSIHKILLLMTVGEYVFGGRASKTPKKEGFRASLHALMHLLIFIPLFHQDVQGGLYGSSHSHCHNNLKR